MKAATGSTADVRLVRDFDEPCAEGRALLGGKGAGLAEMTQLGIPVPAGFTITTAACRATMATGSLPPGLEAEIDEHLRRLETQVGRRFGDPKDPLLLSVRSGAAISMPGMMDTVLDLGLSTAGAHGLAATTGNPRFAWDCYRRLIQMFGEVVDGIDAAVFEGELERLKERVGVVADVELGGDELRELAETFLDRYAEQVGRPFPQDANEQLTRAVRAVFESWNAPRARVYRRATDIPDDLGTAVNVVQMVFGNRDRRSATGVCFTRNPSTGERRVYGEFLLDAQGEDVVAGIRTPEPLEQLHEVLPDAYAELVELLARLETHYRDLQDVEFTVESGRLYVLQTRSGKRTATAAVRVAIDMVDEELITREEAVARLDPAHLDRLLHPALDPTAPLDEIATGLAASPGAASGAAVFDADEAERRGRDGEAVILVRAQTSAGDVHGMLQSRGVVTAHGGMTSHAAVVARGLGIPCVAGVASLALDPDRRAADFDGVAVGEGDLLTIDGATGRVLRGAVPLVQPELGPDFRRLLRWADALRRLDVLANADTPADATKARELGAEGIGLCRTEHMFMAEERLPVMRRMILAEGAAERGAALAELLPMQQRDFEGIFEAMAGLPVTIRLLDPPLHEFLPPLEEAADEAVRARILELREENPMLGTRGCRLGLLWPEIYEMQVRAIVRAARAVDLRTGTAPAVEVMIPLVAFASELERLRELTLRTAAEEGGLDLSVGTMIELPRACMCAGEIARFADFFSFGTNDLTQTALGLSRDDAGAFLQRYLEDGVLHEDPFATLDRPGVGALMRLAVEQGRAVRPGLRVGICGEHGGDPASIGLCDELGLDYVSCSPYRVPVARVAAAQAALERVGASPYVPAGG